jgi:cellulose synthase/poly-beta-1,6-N-acetylglucosamine synthase-like glycosyltransferase
MTGESAPAPASAPAPEGTTNATDRTALMIDVMMPYYGDVPMMQAAVASVLAQTDDRWRLTVVDDGREPGVPEWFAALRAERGDDRVRYLRNERNLGITHNFQKCLDLAELEFVTFLGSDDIMLPNYVATALSLFERHPEVSLVQPGVEVIDETGVVTTSLADRVKKSLYAPKVEGSLVMSGEDLARSLLRGNWMYFPAICWRTEAIAKVGFNTTLTICQDLAVTLQLVRDGGSLAIGGELAFQYRRHAVSESSAQAFSGTRFTEERRFFLAQAQRMADVGWPRAARAGRRHLSSRLHAASLVPGAVKRREGVGALLGYALGPAKAK